VLISYSRKFIFLANVKTASTSVEAALAPLAEIAVCETRLGKHATLVQVERWFRWMFKRMPLDEYFIFGTMRDPVDQMRSLYNFHQGKRFLGKPHSTVGVPFEEFAEGWIERSWQTRQQCAIFRLNDSHRVDAVLRFENLQADFDAVCAHLGIPRLGPLEHKLRSSQHMADKDIPPAARSRIKEHFAEDIAFYEKYAGKIAVNGELRPLS